MDYKVAQVVPRDRWRNDYGEYQTYAVKFEGSDDWIKWNRKFKDANTPPDAPKVGDEVFGKLASGKFTLEKKGYATGSTRGGGDSKPAYKDNSDGQRQGMCFNNANSYVTQYFGDLNSDDWAQLVYKYANELYKLGDLGKEVSGYDQLKATATKIKQEEPDPVIEDIGDEPINLDDIPF